MKVARLFLALGLVAAAARAQLGYVESSTGFQGNPRLDGGRTELELADINNDGHVDILSIGDHGSPFINTQQRGVMVWFGDGAGSWSVHLPSDTFGYGGIAVGDVNNDGYWDVGYAMHHNYTANPLGDRLIEVALGDGTGRSWTAWGDSLAREGQDWGMHATDFGDFDNDGLLDIGSISFGADDGIHVYRNLGNGAWRRTFGFSGGNSNMEFYFRDVNNDGNLDIIAAHGTGSIWFGDGAGDFTPANTGLPGSTGGLRGLSPGDVNNNGGCDVAFANSTGGVEVWTWDEDQQCWTGFSGSLPQADSFQATRLCDMNADGFVDLLAFGRGKTRVWLGDGTGNWADAGGFNTAGAGTYAALRTGADFDHNGRPDIVYWSREGSWPSDINVAHAFRETTSVTGLTVFPVFPRGREKLPNRTIRFVDWWSAAPQPAASRVRLELSTTGPDGPWSPLADDLRNNGRWQWAVPDSVLSPDCRIRYTVTDPTDTVIAITPRSFAIGDTTVSLAGGRPARQPGVLEVRPNPVRPGAPAVARLRGAGGTAVRVFDRSGRQVLDARLDADGTARLDTRGLAAGAYFVRAGDRAGVAKLIVGPAGPGIDSRAEFR
ncbi:MAG: VCBS repeat-containing protein [bacterium]